MNFTHLVGNTPMIRIRYRLDGREASIWAKLEAYNLSGSIKDNDFDGHLCVHFPRTMEETAKLDPKNGVRHQKDIRKAWKALTGEDITW